MVTHGSADGGVPPAQLALRLAWVVVRLALAYWLAQHSGGFVYQGF